MSELHDLVGGNHQRAQFEHVAEQRAQRRLVALAEARDRRVIGSA
jgi:hypothetical protein